MYSKFKIGAFVFLFVLLWFPLLQEQARWLPEPKLKGAFVPPTKPRFTLDSLKSIEFQKQLEDYENSNFGFRSLMVKIRNTFNYLVFKELSVTDNIAGKNGYIYSLGSTERTLGIRYNGKLKNNETLEKINFLKEGVEN